MKEGWTYKKLGEVCETSSGGTPSKSHKEYYEGGTIPWLRSGEVSQGLIYNTEFFITDLGLEKSSAKIFPVDTVVIAMYGATVGQVGLLKNEMATNQAVCGIFPNNSLYPLFLLYTLKSKKSLFLKDAVGGAQPNISQNLIKNTIIPIPPIAEQERIVAELDLLSGIIEKKKEQLKAYDQLAQSIFYSMFGTTNHEKGWEVKKLGEVGTFQRGGGFLKSDFVDVGFPCIHYGQIHTKFGAFTHYHLTSISEELAKSKSKFAHKGDVIIAITSEDVEGSCKCVAWLGNYDVAVGAHAAIFRHNLNPIYVSYYFKSSEYSIAKTRYARGFKVVEIKPDDIAKIDIPIPPLSLQQEFAEKVEAIERQKALVQQSIEETQTMFDYTMDKYFG